MSPARFPAPPAYLGPNGRAEWCRRAGPDLLAATVPLLELVCALADLLALLNVELLLEGEGKHELANDEHGQAVRRAARRIPALLRGVEPLLRDPERTP